MIRLASAVLIAVIWLGWVLAVQAQPAVGKRVALVIGNSKYQHESPLANPANDAAGVAAALKAIKFDDVEVVLDADLIALQSALARFARRADGAEVALVYYSGHGIEVDGRNYLVPTSAKLMDAADVDFEAVPMDLVVSAADRARSVKLIVLDACRNNPFAARMIQRQGRRSVGRGLAPVNATTGMLVAYSARAGTVAEDGPAGGMSPFTQAFTRHVGAPATEVRLMLGRVRDDVVRATGRQEPFTYGSLGGDAIYLNPASVPAPAAAAPQPVPGPRASDAAEAWSVAEKSTDPAVLEAYIRRFGDTFYGDLAKSRLASLRDERQRVALLQKQEDDRKRAEAAAAAKAAEDKRRADEEAAKRDPAAGVAPGSGRSFRDCPDCPEMVVVPAGSFMMGSPQNEPHRESDEGPQRRVTIAKPFAVGKFEVTFAEWDACVSAGACKLKPEASWGSGRQPVMRVSWDDITKEYLPWLSRKTGKTYRLLSEAEWEYAARAGTTTPFSFGQTISTDEANYDGNYTYGGGRKGVYRQKTIEVGSLNKPNAWGLHDMHGNVWEWVADCYKDSYAGAPTDGSATADTAACARVLRGGSWNNGPLALRSADRNWHRPVLRYDYFGFRLARTLNP
jgi:formylglycine-generating enzyme required for sulfatase activity